MRSLCVTGCGANESVIIWFKASPVQLNLPTGTELGNIIFNGKNIDQDEFMSISITFDVKNSLCKQSDFKLLTFPSFFYLCELLFLF